MAEDKSDKEAAGAVVIKKYANRRLYNTSTSTYVTLEHLSEMVRQGTDFTVQDAKSGEDITRSVLAQIIFEQENRGQHMLPVQFLRRLIRLYGDSMQSFLPAYLEMSMERFSASQEQWREAMQKTWAGRVPMNAFEEQARANMAMFEQAMRMWTPFSPQPPGLPEQKPEAKPESEPPAGDALSDIRKQMEAMQRQLDIIAGTRKP